MSQDNVDLVRAAFDAYFRGDTQAMLSLTATDVTVTQFPDQVIAHTYHGQRGLMHVMADWLDTWDDWSIEILTAREAGNLVIATGRQRGRGKGSGAPMEADATFVFAVEQRKIAHWQMFRSEQEALSTVGLGD